MARIGISITKSVAFRNSTQEFSNVYFYENGGGLPDQGAASNIIDELVAIEKTFHANTVTFLRGRLWSQVGSPGSNEMINQKGLTGLGSATPDATMDRERAFLFRWRAGNDSRGHAVYLRKWYHACGVFPGSVSPVPGSVLANTAGFAQSNRDTMATNANAVVNLTSGGGPWSLVAKSGRARDTGFSTCHQYLEHHQLGDMWRAQ